jgi:hypothetical protein
LVNRVAQRYRIKGFILGLRFSHGPDTAHLI